MDGEADGGTVAWLIDAVAAAVLAVAIGVCGVWLGGSVATSTSMAGGALLAVLCLLRLVPPEPQHFALAAPKLAPWGTLLDQENAHSDCLELEASAIECLELVDRIDACPLSQAGTAKVTTLRPALLSPGEMQRRIDRHLQGVSMPDEVPTSVDPVVVSLCASPSAALRQALLDLRRAAG